MQTSNLTALALIPDSKAWPAIQSLRHAYDRQIDKWPPHMNVFYPFVPEHEFPNVLPGLAAALASSARLKLHFRRMGNFGGTVYLAPECEEDPDLRKFHAACKGAFEALPEKHDSFQPHLTIGQFKGAKGADAFIAQHGQVDLEADVSHVYLLARDDMKSPFRTAFRVQLGGGVWEAGSTQLYVADVPWSWAFACLPQCSRVAAGGLLELKRSVSDGLARSLSRSTSKRNDDEDDGKLDGGDAECSKASKKRW